MKLFHAKSYFILMLLFTQFCQAQIYAYKKSTLYLLGSDYLPVKNEREATYILQLEKSDDTTFICRYYNTVGPIVRQESFFDSGLTIPNGEFAWYDANGNIDSLATVSRGKKISFTSFNDSLKGMISIHFYNGSIYEKRDYVHKLYTDSTGNTSDLTEKEKKEHEKFATDSAAAKAEPPKFKKGAGDWQKYVSNHIAVPDRFTNVMKTGSYTLLVSFLVNKKGEVTELLLLRSCELSADLEVLDVLKKSPLWQPATMYGKPVIYRQKQSMTFTSGY